MATIYSELKRELYARMKDNMPTKIDGRTVFVNYGQVTTNRAAQLWVEFQHEIFSVDGLPTIHGKGREGMFQWNCYARGRGLYVIDNLIDKAAAAYDQATISTANYHLEIYEPNAACISRDSNMEQWAITWNFIIRGAS